MVSLIFFLLWNAKETIKVLSSSKNDKNTIKVVHMTHVQYFSEVFLSYMIVMCDEQIAVARNVCVSLVVEFGT